MWTHMSGLCGEDCSLKSCKELVQKCLPCGHEVKLPCPDDTRRSLVLDHTLPS